MQLKYTGKLGYYEARYRLSLGDRDKILEKIKELKEKKEPPKPDLVQLAQKVFYETR